MTTDSFLLIVTKVKLVGTIKGSKILKITKVDAATLNVILVLIFIYLSHLKSADNKLNDTLIMSRSY